MTLAEMYFRQFTTAQNLELALKQRLKEWKVQVTEQNINWKRNDLVEFDYVVLRMEPLKYREIKAFVAENDCVTSFSYSPLRLHTP